MLKRFASIILLLLPLIAAAEDFVVGKDYELISGYSKLTKASPKVEVTEFFSYGCPWCYRVDPLLMDWVKQQANNIQFSRVPVVFNKDWVNYAKAYYTAQHLNLEPQLTPLLFKAIQAKGEHGLNSNQAMIDFFTAQGVKPEAAKSAFENSTTIDMDVNQGMLLMSRYHVNGVPAVVINDQYKTDLQMAKDPARFIKILDFLVAKAGEKDAS